MFEGIRAAYRAFMGHRQTVDLRAKWDAARTTGNNKNLWSGADALSAAAAGDPLVRATLRQRSRYECQESNSYGKGFVLSLADFTIGRGPSIRVDLGNEQIDRLVQNEFNGWFRSIGGPEKARTAKMSKTVDGEVFFLEVTNRQNPSPVKLDFKLFEAEQCSSPEGDYVNDENRHIDGIWYDNVGNPTRYDILLDHPGGLGTSLDATAFPANRVIHLFRVDRPGQKRGIPETAPALPLFPILRQYTMATLEAATSAAYWQAVIHSRMPSDQSPAQIDGGAFQPFDLERNAVMNLPDGWDISQLKPEHPTTTYAEFKREVLNEIARCLNVPFNVAAGNSSEYNFASGRLDWQIFFRMIEVERNYFERAMLDRMFFAWLSEARLIPDYLPVLPDTIPHRWLWDGQPIIDPVKEANATVALFNAGLLDEDKYWANSGEDTQEVYRRMSENLNQREELGLPLPASGETNAETESEEEIEEEETSEPSGRSGAE